MSKFDWRYDEFLEAVRETSAVQTAMKEPVSALRSNPDDRYYYQNLFREVEQLVERALVEMWPLLELIAAEFDGYDDGELLGKLQHDLVTERVQELVDSEELGEENPLNDSSDDDDDDFQENLGAFVREYERVVSSVVGASAIDGDLISAERLPLAEWVAQALAPRVNRAMLTAARSQYVIGTFPLPHASHRGTERVFIALERLVVP